MKNSTSHSEANSVTDAPAKVALKEFLSEKKEKSEISAEDMSLQQEFEILKGNLNLLESMSQKNSFLTRELKYLTKS